MMKMRKLFFKLSMLLFVLAMSVNAAWGAFDLAAILGGMNDLGPDDYYYTQLVATPSPLASGTVQLMWIDMHGDTINANDISDTSEKAKYSYAYNQLNPGASGYSNPTGYVASPQLVGTTILYGDMEVGLGNQETHVYVTSFAYFKAEPKPADGWYFDSWSYVDNGQITMLDSLKDENHVYWPTEAIPNNNGAVVFKIKPHNQKGTSYLFPNAEGRDSIFRYVQANFKPVLLDGYSGGKGEIIEGNSFTTIDVVVNIEAKKAGLTTADFNSPVLDNSTDFTVTEMNGDVVDGKPIVRMKIKYQPASFSVGNFYKTNLTVSSKGGSTIVIPLEVRAVAANRTQATLYNADGSIAKDGDDDVDGDLDNVLSKISQPDQVVQLNKDFVGNLIFSDKTFTFDLNGYSAGNMTVSSGDVTVAYSRFGGSLSSVVVAGGKLTLNGGNIEASGTNNVAAVTVMPGATLIQNGATISASVSETVAMGLYVLGTANVTDGSISAHADEYMAFAANVGAGGKLIVNGGTLSATVNQTDNPTPVVNNQNTWSNVYSVFVSSGTGEAEINGGTFNATSDYAGAFAVCGLASMGKLTVGKKAIVNAHSGCHMPTAYAVGLLNESELINKADATINGGRFSATYMKNNTEKTPCPPFLCAVYDKFTFKSGYISADSVYVRDKNNFPMSILPVNPTLYNVVRNGKDWNDGYRYIAVDESKATAQEAGVPVACIGTTGYAKLEDAIAYANNNPSEEGIVIMIINDCILPAGYYTLPANATIVVPKSDNQTNSNSVVERTVKVYQKPSEFRRLTFAPGVKMEVFGSIEVSGTQHAYDTGNGGYNSNPWGPYGLLVLEDGVMLTLQDGAHIYAWGFVIGQGEIDVRRGATIHEQFQMGDWKGGTTSFSMLTDERGVFPVTQYWIQNVECSSKFHPGSILTASAAVSVGSGLVVAYANDINIVGVNNRDDAMFLLDNEADAENTWVRKWYDVENDLQVYDVNNTAHIGSIVLKLGKLGDMNLDMNSALFKLPITNNMKIHLLSGFMDFTQDTYLLPGAEVEVDKESVVSISVVEEEGVHSGSLYVYDADDWGDYILDISGTGGKKFTKAVLYEPIIGGRPSVRPEFKDDGQKDAAILVHGQFDTDKGYIYTSEHGANIYSTNEDAGTFSFTSPAKPVDYTESVYHADGTSISDTPDLFYPAQLRNGDGSSQGTGGTGANMSYCYMNDEWRMLFYFDCFAADVDMEKYAVEAEKKAYGQSYDLGSAVKHLYIKPQEWVEIVGSAEIEFDWSEPTPDYEKDPYNPYLIGVTGNEGHTYSDAAGTGRLFIQTITKNGDCDQWWEVENVDNLYHCIHPNNDTYYYWGLDENNTETWVEKKYTITWKNWNGEEIKSYDYSNPNDPQEITYDVTYGTMAEFLGTNPTREANIDSTYNFTGWKPALGPVTQDVTYTATFESQPRMYTIRFLQEGGVEIERQFLEHNAVPICENTPTKVGHTLVWSPAISPVIGDQTYTATWLENPPTEWDVTFVNNAGGVLKETEAVGVSDHPVYSGSTPAKENADHTAYSSNEYTYTFWGWSAVIDGVAQQFADGEELPSPTAPTTYTAVYTEAAKTYEVKFITYNGNATNPDHVIASGSYTYGATPIAPTIEQVFAAIADENTPNYTFNNDKYTYSFAWDPQIQTVMGTQNYTATIDSVINQYTVTLKSNLSGVCTFTGAGTFDYGTNITNVAVSYNGDKYTFDGWSDLAAEDENKKNSTHPSFTLTGDVALTANFTPIALSDHTVATGDAWDVPEETEVKDLIITSDGSACGQLLNPENLTIRGEAIFRMNQSFDAGQWYAVAVPWRVNPATGIYGASGRLASGSQIYIIEFDGAAYAQVGGTDDTYQYWHFLHETGAEMVPGKLYMIYLASAQSKLDFHKKAGAALQTRNLTVSTANGSAGASFANWNAISNPALYTADLSTGVTAYQTYNNNGDQTYTVVNAATSGIIVAKPIFVQVSTPGTVYASVPSGPDPAPAYRRSQQAENEAKFVVEISRNGKMADRLIVETADEKENRYVIGQDLAKFGVSSKVAQMWVNRYDAKLCVNTTAWDGERAEYPLSIFAPASGDYTITNTNASADYALYLTLNGEAIWNLSEGAYVLSQERGTATNYGLRVSARAPQNATGVDEAIIDAKGETATKVLIDNQVFIIRGDKVYTIDGQVVK